MGFTPKSRAEKQRVIDEYLAATGANSFVPGEFIDWLSSKPKHPIYPVFFGLSDRECAREHRIELARKFVFGLRIQVKTEVKTSKVTRVKVLDYPAFISPLDGRKGGGGYIPFDPKDPSAIDELRRQGAMAMQSWLNRYRAVFDDLDRLDQIASFEAEG